MGRINIVINVFVTCLDLPFSESLAFYLSLIFGLAMAASLEEKKNML